MFSFSAQFASWVELSRSSRQSEVLTIQNYQLQAQALVQGIALPRRQKKSFEGAEGVVWDMWGCSVEAWTGVDLDEDKDEDADEDMDGAYDDGGACRDRGDGKASLVGEEDGDNRDDVLVPGVRVPCVLVPCVLVPRDLVLVPNDLDPLARDPCLLVRHVQIQYYQDLYVRVLHVPLIPVLHHPQICSLDLDLLEGYFPTTAS